MYTMVIKILFIETFLPAVGHFQDGLMMKIFLVQLVLLVANCMCPAVWDEWCRNKPCQGTPVRFFYLFSSCQIISFLQNTFQTNKKQSLESAVFRLYLRTPVFSRKWMNFKITLWSSLLVFEFSVAHFPPILAKRGIPKKQRIHPMSKCLIFYQGQWKQLWQLHPRKEIHTLMDVHLFKRSLVLHWGKKIYF